MLSGGAQIEPDISDSDKDNGDRRDYPPAHNKSGIPRYHKPPSVMGPSHRYQDQDAYPLRCEIRSPQLGQPPAAESQHAPTTKGSNIPSHDQNKGEGHHGSDPASTPRPSSPPGPWAGFRSEEELWEFLKTVIPHDDHNKGQNREETDPVTSCYMRFDPTNRCTSNKKQRAQDKQKDQPTNKI